MSGYDTSARWDDPYDRPVERRVARRFPVPMELKIGVNDSDQGVKLVGPGLVMDISRVGASVRTKHRLRVAQRVGVAIPTELCREIVFLPKRFVGSAEVVRLDDAGNGVSKAALRFGSEFSQNMEFALFMDSLHSLTHTAG